VGLFLLAASLPATSSAQIDIRATFTEGLAAYRTGSYAQAAELFGQCRELAPQVPEYGLWEATALIRAEEYREALPVLQAVLEYAPDSALARGHLGLVWHQLGSPQAAISELRSALSIDPAYDAARQNLSTVLMQQKRLDEAEALWRERLDQGLESALLREGLALVLERRGEYSQALAEAEAALALAPDSPDLIALSARLNLYAGSERVGLAQMASLDAPSVTHVEGFAAALLASGSVVDAIAHLEQPGIRDRLSAEGLATLAEGLRREGRWDELQPVLGQLVETRAFQRRWWPEDKAPVFATLAWLAERSGDRETATDWARQALNLDPAQPTALRILQGMRPGPEALAAIEAELIAGSTDIAAARYYLSETTRQPDHMPPAEVIAALQAWPYGPVRTVTP
jgi:tetratricopeptide (TPR) repeat protein